MKLLIAVALVVTVACGCAVPTLKWTLTPEHIDSVSGNTTMRLSSRSMSGTVDHGVATYRSQTLTLTTPTREREIAIYMVPDPKCLVVLLPPFGSSADAMPPLVWPILQQGCSCIVGDHSYDPERDTSIEQFASETMASVPYALDPANAFLPAAYHTMPLALYGASYGSMVVAELVRDTTFTRRVRRIVVEAPIEDVPATWGSFSARLPGPFRQLPPEIEELRTSTILRTIAPDRVAVIAGRMDPYLKNVDLDRVFSSIPPSNLRFMPTAQHHFRAGVDNDAETWIDINLWIARALCTPQ